MTFLVTELIQKVLAAQNLKTNFRVHKIRVFWTSWYLCVFRVNLKDICINITILSKYSFSHEGFQSTKFMPTNIHICLSVLADFMLKEYSDLKRMSPFKFDGVKNVRYFVAYEMKFCLHLRSRKA